MSLFEKYRPKTWAEVVGQDKVKTAVERLRSRSALGGRAYWIVGKSGQGKSSIARLLAHEIAGVGDTTEVDAKDLRTDTIRDMQKVFALANGSFCGLWKDAISGAWIINEAHALTNGQVTALLTALEPVGGIPSRCTVIFTTTNCGENLLIDGCFDANPFLSRCTSLELEQRGVGKKYATRLQEIARIENLDGKPIGDYERLFSDCGSNMRKALERIELGVMVD